MNTLALRALRPLIVVLFAGSLATQLIVMIAAWSIAFDYPNRAAGVFYGAAGFVVVVCAQIALVAMWKLLALVRSDHIFTPDAFRWVDLIIRVGWIATGLCLSVSIYQAWARIGPLPASAGLVGSAVAALATTLLVLVLRQLLASAVEYKAELAEVV